MRWKLINLSGRLSFLAFLSVLLVSPPQIAFCQSGIPQPPVNRTDPTVIPSAISDANLAVPAQNGREVPSNSILLKKIEPLLLLLLGLFLFLAATGIKQRRSRANSASGSVAERQLKTLASPSSGQSGPRTLA